MVGVCRLVPGGFAGFLSRATVRPKPPHCFLLPPLLPLFPCLVAFTGPTSFECPLFFFSSQIAGSPDSGCCFTSDHIALNGLTAAVAVVLALFPTIETTSCGGSWLACWSFSCLRSVPLVRGACCLAPWFSVLLGLFVPIRSSLSEK